MEFRRTFQIGLNGTATRSVATAIKFMDPRLNVVHSLPTPKALGDIWQYANCLLTGSGKCKWFGDYDFVGELAAPLWKEVDETFTGARFILNVRPLDDWIKSTIRKTHPESGTHYRRRRMRLMRSEIQWMLPGIYQLKTFGSLVYTPRHAEIYQRHNEDVVEYFIDRGNDLLVFDCFNGDSWQELSGFLGLLCPSDVEFPWVSASRHADSAARKMITGSYYA